MSFKYSRFFASTCLSLAVTSFLIIPGAKAGFEWTPPEKKALVESSQALPPASHETATLPLPIESASAAKEIPVEAVIDGKPEITIKVLDDLQEQPTESVVDDLIEQRNDVIEVVDRINEPNVQNSVIEIIEDDIIEIPLESEKAPHIAEERVPDALEEEAHFVEDVTTPQPLTLDFAPDTSVNTSTQPINVLPEDTGLDINEITLPEETSSEEALTVEPPTEDIFWAKNETFDVIDGFGKDLPLALALRQVVPARYAFSFGQGVNAGTKVSWVGGKPWNEVLEATLTPIGLDFVIKRSTLIEFKVSDQPAEKIDLMDSIEEQVGVDAPIVIDVPDISVSNSIESVETVAEEIEKASVVEDEISPLDEIYRTSEKREHNILETDASDFPDIVNPSEFKSDVSEAPLADQKKNSAPRIDAEAPGEEVRLIPEETIIWTSSEVPPKPEIIDIESQNFTVPDDPVSSNQIEGFQDTIEIVENDILDDFNSTPVPSLPSSDLSSPDNVVVEADGPIDLTSDKEDDRGMDTSDSLVEEAFVVPADMNLEVAAPFSETTSITEELAKDVAEQDIEKPTEAIRTFRSHPSQKLLVWEARKGKNVKDILQHWAEIENIEYSWHGSDDFEVNKDVFISGTFSNAVEILLSTSVKNPPSYRFNEAPHYALFIDSE